MSQSNNTTSTTESNAAKDACTCHYRATQVELLTTKLSCSLHPQILTPAQLPVSPMEMLKHHQQSSWIQNTPDTENDDPFGFKSATTSPIPTRPQSREDSIERLDGEDGNSCQKCGSDACRGVDDRKRGCERPTIAVSQGDEDNGRQIPDK
jgi:hypothetical protein